MLTAETHIQTERPSRYLVQLCKHADGINHKILHLHASKAQARPPRTALGEHLACTAVTEPNCTFDDSWLVRQRIATRHARWDLLRPGSRRVIARAASRPWRSCALSIVSRRKWPRAVSR